ncbi:hypothetical protein LCGC14_1027400 [marine sediment metagenome]|uniref:Uncharacterized protein n=1 Tax=marine sediment metagenome TaxID=412755 RepID=A0A0F9R1L8_9ZZZZ
MCARCSGELNSAWSNKPPSELLPGYYQVAHVENRKSTWVIEVRQSGGNLYVPLPGGGVKDENEFHTLPWLWGPRINLVEVPCALIFPHVSEGG